MLSVARLKKAAALFIKFYMRTRISIIKYYTIYCVSTIDKQQYM